MDCRRATSYVLTLVVFSCWAAPTARAGSMPGTNRAAALMAKALKAFRATAHLPPADRAARTEGAHGAPRARGPGARRSHAGRNAPAFRGRRPHFSRRGASERRIREDHGAPLYHLRWITDGSRSPPLTARSAVEAYVVPRCSRAQGPRRNRLTASGQYLSITGSTPTARAGQTNREVQR